MNIRVNEGIFYTTEHEWAKIEGNTAKVGISDYAQQKLGDITLVEVPLEGKDVSQFDYLASIESVKAATDIYSPLSGKVIAVNEELEESPELISQSPYEDGWIIELEISNPDETKDLMEAEHYRKYTGELE